MDWQLLGCHNISKMLHQLKDNHRNWVNWQQLRCISLLKKSHFILLSNSVLLEWILINTFTVSVLPYGALMGWGNWNVLQENLNQKQRSNAISKNEYLFCLVSAELSIYTVLCAPWNIISCEICTFETFFELDFYLFVMWDTYINIHINIYVCVYSGWYLEWDKS